MTINDVGITGSPPVDDPSALTSTAPRKKFTFPQHLIESDRAVAATAVTDVAPEAILPEPILAEAVSATPVESEAPEIPGDAGLGGTASLLEPTPSPQEPASSMAPVTAAVANPTITVVRDPNHWLGKKLELKPDGTFAKASNVNLSFGIAVQHHVPTHADLAALLTEVSNDPSAAIINASFDGVEVGEEFVILSQRELEKRLGIPRIDREKQKGVHLIQHEGRTIKAVGRFKENVRASVWQLLDRDNDKHTPAKYAAMPFDKWLLAVAKILPGIADISYVRTPSTSSRVLNNGVAITDGNGHVWIKIDDPADVERVRTAILIAAAKAELTWLKPRFSRNDPDKVVGHSLTTITDPSVWTPGRLVFDGKPTVGDGLTVAPLSPVVHVGANDSLDTSAVILPDTETIRKITREAGIEMDVQHGDTGLRIVANDLTLDTELETEGGEYLAVRQLLERGDPGKVRIQTPFRASVSWAAFYSIGADGKPFVYDVGTGVTHWLNDKEASQVQLIVAMATAQAVLEKSKADVGAPFEPAALAALAVILLESPADYYRLRATFKQTNGGVSVVALDRAVKRAAAQRQMSEQHVAQTHHGYAKDVLDALTVKGWAPVCYEGVLWVLCENGVLWEKYDLERIERLVPESHDGKENCVRKSDYTSVAHHAMSLASDPRFFAEAAIGIASPGGFLQVVDDVIETVPLTPEHRQRVMLPFTPADLPTPMFDQFLQDTFGCADEDEMKQQLALIQEITGATMTGIMPRFQKAVMYYEPYGRAGKGTYMKITSGLVPADFVRAVSPFRWDDEYYLAMLAGARLNEVGELPDDKPIPAAAFKTVIGGDLLTGRHPAGRPISFKNAASHIFMTNHLITTKDQSEAFFTRWKLVEFPNSRLRSGLPIDTTLAERIIAAEMPGIAYWAIQGAARLLRNRKFSESIAHDRLMAKWRKSTNSLEEFIGEVCTLDAGLREKRSEFYLCYTAWCKESGRKPFGKSKVRDLLEHNVGMGLTLVQLDGYETFKGLQVNAAFKKSVFSL